MELEAIPGVGAKTAAALRELDDPAATVESGDVAAIARAPGVNEARAARIARGAIRRRHGDDGRVLATDRAREVYREAIDLLRERTVTDYAAKRLETFYPSASASRIAEAQSFVESAIERDPDPAVREALAGVEPLTDPPTVRVRDRCLATADAETLARAEAAVPELSVETVEDARDVSELARSYATVIVLDEEFAGLDVEGDVHVRPDALDEPAETVPERLLAFFAANRERLEAAAAVHEAAATAGDPVSDGDPAADPDRLRDALARLDDDGTVVGDVSPAGGQVAGAGAFDGSGGRVEIPDDPSLGVTNVTVSAWVYRDGSKNREYIVDGRNHNYGIKLEDGTSKPLFFVNASNSDSLTAGTNIPDQTWTHVVGTYDGSEVKLYVDGTAEATGNGSGDIATTAGPARIGDYIQGGYKFRGRIDDVRVYVVRAEAAQVRVGLTGREPAAAAVAAGALPWVLATQQTPGERLGEQPLAEPATAGKQQGVVQPASLLEGEEPLELRAQPRG